MKKKLIPILGGVALILIMVAVIIITNLVKKYTPTDETQDLGEYYEITSEDQPAILLNNNYPEEYAKVIDGEIYLELDFIKENLNDRFYWDSNENLLLYATGTSVYTADVNTASYTKDKNNLTHSAVICKINAESCYVHIDYVSLFSDFTYSYYTDPNRLLIWTGEDEVTVGTIKKDTQVRVLGGIKSPILKELVKSDTVYVLATDETWSQVMTEDGVIGYVMNKKLNVTEDTVVLNTSDYTAEEDSHVFFDQGEVCLGWHPVYARVGSTEAATTLSSTEGLNVVSPTFFYLNDAEGSLGDYCTEEYVKYCHNQDISVWGLCSDFGGDAKDYASQILPYTSKRIALENQIIAKALSYNLDGINIDFEYITEDIAESYIQFMRELAIKCHNNGLILSVDTYTPSNSLAYYDITDQAHFVDYVIIMGYDEHWPGSDSGSVASLSWVTEAVANTLELIPNEQFILAMPFYTRLWELTLLDSASGDEVLDINDSYEVTGYSAYGLDSIYKAIGSHYDDAVWDEDCGQYYVEWSEDDGATIYRVWIEDSTSLELKLKLMDDNELAGCAFWSLYFANDTIWDTVIKYINEAD